MDRKERIDAFLKLRSEVYADALTDIFSAEIPLHIRMEAIADLEKDKKLGLFLKDNYPEYYLGHTVFAKDDYATFALLEDVQSDGAAKHLREFKKQFWEYKSTIKS